MSQSWEQVFATESQQATTNVRSCRSSKPTNTRISCSRQLTRGEAGRWESRSAAGRMLRGCWRNARALPGSRSQSPEQGGRLSGNGRALLPPRGNYSPKKWGNRHRTWCHKICHNCSALAKNILERRAPSYCCANCLHGMSSSSIQLRSSSQYSLKL